MTLRAGFIGLGNIGKPMAAQLPKAGFDATVYDIDPAPVKELVEAGARTADTPRELGERCDVVGICVPEDAHVRAVLLGDDGLLAGAARGTVVGIHSTIQPETAIELAALGDEAGVTIVDACVTGGAAVAEAGELTYLIGGAAEAVEKLRPFLEPSAAKIIHAGELGSGAKLKLAVNVLTYLEWAASYEAFTLAKASGLDVDLFVEATKSNGQLTPLMERYLLLHRLPEEAIANEDLQRGQRGYMNVAEKDLAWALQLARKSGVTLPHAGLVSQQMARIYRVIDEGRR